MKRVEIISIGDELLIGQTVNSNASFLGRGLTAIGLAVTRISTIADNAADLVAALDAVFKEADFVIATGGLGPTHDDITKAVAADYFGSTLSLNDEILGAIKKRFRERGQKMAPVNREQAMVPEKAEVIRNAIGTAPGLIFERDGRKCFILPGVPAEMKAMCEETVFPMLRSQGEVFLQKTIRTTGIPESTLFEKMGDIGEIESLAKTAFLPKPTGVDIRLMVKGSDSARCQEQLGQAVRLVVERVREFIYAYDDKNLEEVVAGELLANGQTVAVAESCSGGLLANRLTDVPGSSGYFERGVVTYSNRSKRQLLGVPEIVLEQKGAVSEATALAMADGIRRLAGTDIGVSTTGIAGPTGGTADKPVGLVFVGVATAGQSFARRYVFRHDRLAHKERTVHAALKLLHEVVGHQEE